MKKTKFFSLLSLCILLFSLSGCSKNEETSSLEEEDSESSSSSESTPEEEEKCYLGFQKEGTLYFATGDNKMATMTPYGVISSNIDHAAKFEITSSFGNQYYISTQKEDETIYMYFKQISGIYEIHFDNERNPIYWNEEFNCWTDKTSSRYISYDDNYLVADSLDSLDGPLGPVVDFISIPTITSLSLSIKEGETESLTVGNTTRLVASYLPSNIADSDLTYSSSNESVCAVDSLGRVTGLSVGEAIISATTKNGVSASYTIQVKENTGTSVSKSKVITFSSLKEDMNFDLGLGYSDTLVSYDGFEILWNEGGKEEENNSNGLYFREGVKVSNYVNHIALLAYTTSEERATTFEIRTLGSGQINKITLISTCEGFSYGLGNLTLSNTDYNGSPIEVDSHSDLIEANVNNPSSSVTVSLKASSPMRQCCIYSISVDYTLTL